MKLITCRTLFKKHKLHGNYQNVNSFLIVFNCFNHWIFTFSIPFRKPSFTETLKLLISPSSLKPFIILVAYFGLYQFSGVNTVTFYAVDVFNKSGTKWDANTCTIVMGVIRLIFTIVGCISMRHFGKRPLTFLSSKFIQLFYMRLPNFILI